MLSSSGFPHPLPLTQPAALAMLSRLDDFHSARGHFVAYVMVPLEERYGEYRFAGGGETLTDVLLAVESFAQVMRLVQPDDPGLVKRLLEFNGTGPDDYCYPRKAPIADLGEHELILCVQSGAPYDDHGVCIVELPALAGTRFEGRAPDTIFPREWRRPSLDWLLEEGEKRFGPPPSSAVSAIRRQRKRKVWTRWVQEFEKIRGWKDFLVD
jgi:hypothetical protein